MTIKHLLSAAVLALCCSLTWACTPLTRGFSDNHFVSNGFPAVTIGSSLPTMLKGKGTAFVLSNNFQMAIPEYWLSVYGSGDASAPMAISVYTTAPVGYEWEPGSFVELPRIGTAEFGGTTFGMSIRTVHAEKDAFAGLFIPKEQLRDNASQINWVAVRFTDMSENFWRTKIILEYREAMPASLVPNLKPALYLENPDIQNIIRRAQEAFTVTFETPDAPIQTAQYIEDSRFRAKLLKDFLGTLRIRENFSIIDDNK